MSKLFIYHSRETGEQRGSSDLKMIIYLNWHNIDHTCTSDWAQLGNTTSNC